MSSTDDSLSRAEELLARLEAARGELDQLAEQEGGSPDRALEIQARPLILIEAILLVGERTRQRLANERLLGLEVGRERPFGQAGLAHDPCDPGGGDAVSAEAFGRYIDYVPSCRRLMTLLETHRSFPFSKLMARLRRSRLKRRM